ncbi:MAG TPA: glycosyltransferase [Methylomirabilota bacterium]|nr:glycosyltransferase [Methylomirabilota bacterium]
MTAAALAFWLAAALLGYTWVAYPLLVRVAGRLARSRPRDSPHRTPRVSRPRLSVIVAAFNEATWILAKVDGTLAQRYPAGRLEVIVVSDGSTDATDAVVARHPDPRVRLIRQEPRAGKSSALNRGVAAARGDVLVFTDANALFGPGALARLAAPFADPRVGMVSGQGLYTAAGGDARAVASGYLRYEALIRHGESALGFQASADGAVYALRRGLYRDLDAAEVNDLLHPIQAALDGFTSRFEPAAFTVEPPSRDGGQEFRRHVRIVAQGMHLLRRWLPPLVAARRWGPVWMLLSHRALRWTTAPALAVLASANVLWLEREGLYAAALAGQAAFYALALTGWLAERAGHRLGRLAVPYYFCLVSAAGVAGLARFLRGGAQAVWAPAGAGAAERAA